MCRLSHHTSTSLSHVRDPFLVIADVKGTFELSSCYNVTIDCRSSEMVATITTNKIFSGKIYAKDNPNSCVVDVENDIQFSISMTYNDIGCDVKREELGVYTNQVSQWLCHFHPIIICLSTVIVFSSCHPSPEGGAGISRYRDIADRANIKLEKLRD